MQHTFDLSPQLDGVDKVVQALRAMAEPILGSQTAVAFEVAVSEALTNIVVHGYKGRDGGQDITIHLSSNPDALQVTLVDHGTPGPENLFDQGPDLHEIDFMQESGRGLALIRHHADAVSYTPSPNGNQLILKFNVVNDLETVEGVSKEGKDP